MKLFITMPSNSERSDMEFPEPIVCSKPVVTPRPVICRTPAPVTPSPSLALNLGELRKTQKRVAFLLERSDQVSRNISSIFPKPTYQGKCFLCRNNVGDPHTHYQPVTQVGDENQMTQTKRKSIVIPSEWGYGDGQGGTPNSQDRNSRTSGNEVRSSESFPAITDNQRVGGRPAGTAMSRTHASVEKGKSVLCNEGLEYKGDSTGTREQARLNMRTVITTDLTSLGAWLEGEAGDESGKGVLENDIHLLGRYHKSRRQDSVIRIGTPRSGVQSGRFFQFNPNPESSVSLSLGKWCECVNYDIAKGECRECNKIGGHHEKWCRFQTGECPDCGKPVRGKHRGKFRSVSFQRFVTSPSNLSISTNSSREGLSAHRSKSTGNELQTSESTRRWKRKVKRKGRRGALNRKHQTSLKTSRVESTIDPNIHKQAYLLALADSRLQKWMNGSLMSSNSICFSYFSLWRNPRSNPESELESIPRIGIRGREVKLKIKDPMKHIFGPVKLSDYYPSGKRFPKRSDKTDY